MCVHVRGQRVEVCVGGVGCVHQGDYNISRLQMEARK